MPLRQLRQVLAHQDAGDACADRCELAADDVRSIRLRIEAIVLARPPDRKI